MSKKSIDKKKLVIQIKSLRMEGKSDQEIYSLVSPEYYDRKTVAQIITATVTDALKEKYKDAQVSLLVALGLTILYKLIIATGLILASHEAVAWLALVLLPALNVYFFVKILRYEAAIYRACGMVAIFGLARVFNGMAKEADWLIVIDILFIGIIAGLSFYLDAKLFPHYSPQKMQADANGDYRVE